MTTFSDIQTKERIVRLMERCSLGSLKGDICPVSGGLLHKMYKVETSTGTYAVKALNPEIMKRPTAMGNYELAESLEKILEEHHLPIVPALSFQGKKMLTEDGVYFYIFRWQEGAITDFDHISSKQCWQAGNILGRIHGIDPKKNEEQHPQRCTMDLDGFLTLAKEKDSPVYPAFNENLEILKKAEKTYNRAQENLPPVIAISNDDMDPKNIMWHQGKGYVIDLECLGYSNPVASCLDLALQWSGTATNTFVPENLKAFFHGYLEAYDNGFRAYEELVGMAYSWLFWLEYNLKRALELECSGEEEKQLGIDETMKTLKRIFCIFTMEEEIREILAQIDQQ